MDRREFLWQAAAGSLALGLGAGEAEAKAPLVPRRQVKYLSDIADAGGLLEGQGLRRRGHVYEAHYKGVYPSGAMKANQAAVNLMLGKMLTKLTGQPTIAKAWSRFVGPGDRVGILIDPVGGAVRRTRREVIFAVIAGLRSAGVKPNDIFIWSANGAHLPHAGFNLNRGAGIKVIGANQLGYDNRYPYKSGGSGLFKTNQGGLSKIVSTYCKHIINIATLEDHPVLGCQMALAQQALASYSNAGTLLRQWGGNPGIGYIAGFPIMKQRFILHIIDALAGAYNGNLGTWHPETLLLSTDPVALDRVGFGKIEVARRQSGLGAISSTRRSPTHINTAASNGAGVANLMQINLHKSIIR